MTFKIEAGKRYVAINGTVTGPLIPALCSGTFKCPVSSVQQERAPGISQVWNSDGTVFQMDDGESEHGLIAEYIDPKDMDIRLSVMQAHLTSQMGVSASYKINLENANLRIENLEKRLSEASKQAEYWQDFAHKAAAQKIFAKPHTGGFTMKKPTTGIVGLDRYRTLDKRIDNAFESIRAISETADRDRESLNGRAVLLGSVAGAAVVVAAFILHFML